MPKRAQSRPKRGTEHAQRAHGGGIPKKSRSAREVCQSANIDIYIYIYLLDSRHGESMEAFRCEPVVLPACRARQSMGAVRCEPVVPPARRATLKSSQNRCQQGSGALGRSQVHSSNTKIAPKSSSGVPRNAFRAARDAPRAPRGGPTEHPERPGAVQSESKRGSAAFRRAKVGFFGICVLVYTGA